MTNSEKTWEPEYRDMGGATYLVNKPSILIHKTPYAKSEINNPNKIYLSQNTPVSVLGSLKNSVGTLWYEVVNDGKGGDGKKYYIVNDYLQKYERKSELIIGGPDEYTIRHGSPIFLQGDISSDCSITSVIATVDGQTYCKELKPNSKRLSIGKSNISYKLKGGSLSVGDHTLIITAKNDSGKKTVKTVTIHVTGYSAVLPPVIEFVKAYPGGVQYRIRQQTPGAKLVYYFYKCATENQGRDFETYNSYVDLYIEESTDITAYSEKNNQFAYYKGAGIPLYVEVPVVQVPEIQSESVADGNRIIITGDSSSSIFYCVNGAEPQPYNGPFTVMENCTISAYAQKDGCKQSGSSSLDVSMQVPPQPAVNLLTPEQDIPVGTAITVIWDSLSNAADYVVLVSRNGVPLPEQVVTQCSASISTTEAGIYSIQVKARNWAGEGELSHEVRVTAHAPSQVTFMTYDGQVIGSPQQVRYRGNAVPPAIPERPGYTFIGWSCNLDGITQDTEIWAEYEINSYTIRYYDLNGSTLLGSETVHYGEPIHDTDIRARVSLDPNCSFVGWHISQCDMDSKQDLTFVDSDLSLVATQKWTEAELPIAVQINSAERNQAATGYDVSLTLSCADMATLQKTAIKAKVIATLKTSSNQMLASEITTFNLEAGEWINSKNLSMFLSYDGNGLADLVEVSVVGIDGNDHTGGALAKTVSVSPTYSAIYTDWMTEDDLIAAGHNPQEFDVQSKTQYSYTEWQRLTTTRTNKTVSFPEIEGYEHVGYRTYWSEPSSWSDSYVAETGDRTVSTREVEISPERTEWKYCGYTNGKRAHFCSETGYRYHGGNWWYRETDWLDHTLPHGDGWGHGYYPGHCSATRYYPSCQAPYSARPNCTIFSYRHSSGTYYWPVTRTIPAQYKTQYCYCDRMYEHTYERWYLDYTSPWSDTQYSDINDKDYIRNVITRKLYRYPTNTPEAVSPEDIPTYTFSGVLDRSSIDLSGKLATVLVYKETNSDPTEPQLEYVGQTTIDMNNSFYLNFQTKELPTTATGDFIVALAPQGSSNVINVNKVFAPKEQHTINFYGMRGDILNTQTVADGEPAKPVEVTPVDGLRFICWDTDVTCITSDMDVKPIYTQEEYSVVFADHENGTVTLRTDYHNGDLLLVPDTPSHEGLKFDGWKVISNQTGQVLSEKATDFTVTEDLIVVANWVPIICEVQFMTSEGTAFESQLVRWGGKAIPPEYTFTEPGMVFLGWSTEHEWWNVTQNQEVYPILAYESTTSTPVSNLPRSVKSPYEVLELTAETGATIYYTLDGSAPDPMNVNTVDDIILAAVAPASVTYIYTGPVELENSVTVRAMAMAAGKNSSEEIRVEYTYEDHTNEDYIGAIPEKIETYQVMAKPDSDVTLNVSVANNPGLMSYLFYIDADPSIFMISYNDSTLEPELTGGEICTGNGSLSLGQYQVGLGWPVIWYGNKPASGDGTLFSIILSTSKIANGSACPVTVSYSPQNILGVDDVVPDMEERFSLSIDKMTTTLGDVNRSGSITVTDVLRIAHHVIGDQPLTAQDCNVADVTCDGKVTNADVIRLARYLIGLSELG